MKIVGISACPAGLAHTPMAAKALENAGKALGYDVKMEQQGSMGQVNEITKEELYQLATMLSKKTRRKKSVELSGWEAPEPIKETQSKCWSCDDAENIIPKLLLGRIQLGLYFLFEGLLQDSNIPKKINGQSRHRL